MSKNVYSLVLSEDVVAAIDRLAYRQNTNRSNMINQILAEYVSYTTPEKRTHEVFARIEGLLTAEDAFQLLLQPSDTLLSLRSALAYKYNPTVRYAVELFRTAGNEIGELRVSLRTQNAALLYEMSRFFRLWAALESRYLGVADSALLDGKFVRKLCLRAVSGETEFTLSSEALGEVISAYIRCFDASLKAFFYHGGDERAEEEAELLFRKYLSGQRYLV